MIILIARLTLNVLANAVGLLAATFLVEGFSINGTSFVIAVAIFSLATTILGPLIVKIALSSAPYLMGGIALITTFVGLLITNFVSDGISISGLSSWALATFVVWVFSLIGSLLLPLVLFKKTLSKNNNSQIS
jgi:uncharacterized membrane protein YvlD (DUF360 family)